MTKPPFRMPPPEFLAACLKVFGNASPATIMPAIQNGDPRMNEVSALLARDPAQWFCTASDKRGVLRLWAKGATEQEAHKLAEVAAAQAFEGELTYQTMAPHTEWNFVPCPADKRS